MILMNDTYEDTCKDCVPSKQSIPLWKEFLFRREKFQLEWKMILYMGLTSFILLVLLVLSYVSFWSSDHTFLAKRGWWFVYLIITVVSTAGTLWHFTSHKAPFSTMVGMIIAMTFGMQAGVMISVVVGSTNGMFMGCLVGVVVGAAAGMYAGRCCGIVGILQGAMAGMMGGTMGPMIALMMKNDNILYFMPIFMILNVMILIGITFLVYDDIARRTEKIEKKPTNFATFFSYCLFTTLIFVLIIVYGYKSAFVA